MFRLVFFSVCLLTNLYAFEPPVPMQDKVPVEMNSGFWGTTLKQNGKFLQPNSVYLVLVKYPECRSNISASKTLFSTGLVLAQVGGVLMGGALGYKIGGGEFYAPIFYSGLASGIFGIVLGSISDKKRINAMKSYNGALGKRSLQLNLTPTHQAVAILTPF